MIYQYLFLKVHLTCRIQNNFNILKSIFQFCLFAIYLYTYSFIQLSFNQSWGNSWNQFRIGHQFLKNKIIKSITPTWKSINSSNHESGRGTTDWPLYWWPPGRLWLVDPPSCTGWWQLDGHLLFLWAVELK